MIGIGSCGAVFAQENEPLAIKLPQKYNEDAVLNDYRMHRRIAEQFKKWNFTAVRIPECHFFASREEPTYLNQYLKLSEVADEVCYLPASALVTERIQPFSKATRSALIHKYCVPEMKEAALADNDNMDCLVRVYLGSMNGKSDRKSFSLRNFKLHMNQMAELQMDVVAMSRKMAVAMAIMHWGARVSGRDVEFVLGCCWRKKSSPRASLDLSGTGNLGLPHPIDDGLSAYADGSDLCRITDLWVLDFNQVQPITMDEEGLKKILEATRINDPYFPRPLQESQIEKQAWNAFAGSYIVASDIILEDSGDDQLLDLPRLYLRGVIEWQQRRHERQAYQKMYAGKICSLQKSDDAVCTRILNCM
ncbi:hypothetical protein ACHAQJ_004207 [Trichoderma viride]